MVCVAALGLASGACHNICRHSCRLESPVVNRRPGAYGPPAPDSTFPNPEDRGGCWVELGACGASTPCRAAGLNFACNVLLAASVVCLCLAHCRLPSHGTFTVFCNYEAVLHYKSAHLAGKRHTAPDQPLYFIRPPPKPHGRSHSSEFIAASSHGKDPPEQHRLQR